jgi:hypothetical protein
MAAKLIKTSTPGVYKRGNRYAISYRDGEGRQHLEAARTYDQARDLLSKRRAGVSDGSYQAQTRERFADYATAWVERYQGTGRKGFAEHTRSDYRRDLKAYAIPRLGRPRLEQITPRHIAEFVAWLCDEQAQERYLADATVRRILAPVRSCLRSAMHEGLIRHNPTQGAALPARDQRKRIEDDRCCAQHPPSTGCCSSCLPPLAFVSARRQHCALAIFRSTARAPSCACVARGCEAPSSSRSRSTGAGKSRSATSSREHSRHR